METEKLSLKREKLLKTLIEEEIEYQHDRRAYWLEMIWYSAETFGYVTKEALQRNLPYPLFEKDEIKQIIDDLRARRIVILERKPSKKEAEKLHPRLPYRTMGIMREEIRTEHEFVTTFATSRFSKALSKLLEELDNREFSRDVGYMFSSSFIHESGFDKKDTLLRAKAFKNDLDLIRKKGLYIQKAVKWALRYPDDLSKDVDPKINSLYTRRVDLYKLKSLWEIASKHGFVTHKVIEELAPAHIIKANQTDQIASFLTELGVHVCDQVPNDEELLKLPEPHISGDTIHVTTEGAFKGIYGVDEWKFLNTFTTEEAKKDTCCPFALDAFTLDLGMDRFLRSNKFNEGK